MRTYIKKLQSKSIETRKQILIGSLILCMSIVFLVWINSLGYKFGKEKVAKNQDVMKPFALFGQSIIDAYGNVTASIGNISSLKKEKSKKVEPEKQIDLIPVEKSNQ